MQHLYCVIASLNPKHPNNQIIIGYEEQEQLCSFLEFPYDDLSFARVVKSLAQWGDTIFIRIDGNDIPLDHKALRQGTRKALEAAPAPIWCVVANLAREHPRGPGGQEVRRGTGLFAPGAKVYCYPPLWGDGYEKIKLVGHHRASHRYITAVVRFSRLTNWRVELIYSPQVIFELLWCWDGSEASHEKASQLVAFVRQRTAKREAE